MISTEEQARAYCAELCDADALARIERFAALLTEENGRQNLVSAASLGAIWQRHIADSLQLLSFVPESADDWLDLGSGPGLPGMVLALARPEMTVHLVESRRKRVEWLQHVKDQFALPNCQIFGSRLENVESFENGVITARAFAPLGKLLSLSARFSTHSTYWLLPKGRSGAQELSEQTPAIREMFHVEQSVTDQSAGILVGKGRPTRL